eukprot:1144767-Pelagomonas_calceolata.AAC.4
MVEQLGLASEGMHQTRPSSLIESTVVEQLGLARKVTVGSTSTTMIADSASRDEIEMRVAQLKKIGCLHRSTKTCSTSSSASVPGSTPTSAAPCMLETHQQDVMCCNGACTLRLSRTAQFGLQWGL